MALFRRRKAVPSSNTTRASGIDRLDHSDIDIWAMRDAGYVDREGLEVLRERFGVTEPLELDYEIEPDADQKQRVIEKYDEIAAYLNAEGWDGRRDWTPRQAWGVGRAATAKQWGRDPAETLLPVPWPRHGSSENDSPTSNSGQESETTKGSTSGCLDLGWVAADDPREQESGESVEAAELRSADRRQLRTVGTLVRIGLSLSEEAPHLTVEKRYESTTDNWNPPPPPGEEWLRLYNVGPDPWTDSDWALISAVVDEVARELETPLTLERLHAPPPEPLDEDE